MTKAVPASEPEAGTAEVTAARGLLDRGDETNDETAARLVTYLMLGAGRDVTGKLINAEALDNLEDGPILNQIFPFGLDHLAGLGLKIQGQGCVDNRQPALSRRSPAGAATTHLRKRPAALCAADERAWEYKKKRSRDMSNPRIDAWYAIVKSNDAHSGKLIGAGVGFLMFYTESKRPMLHAMLKQALEEVRSRFDFEGSTVTMQ